VLTSVAKILNEVTVYNGLYKRPEGNFTGAAQAYSGEELKSVNPRNVLQALAIVDPSVTLAENNQFGSDPNKLPVIQIRGQNNLTLTNPGVATGANAVTQGDISSTYLSNPNQPLIILDGFETTMQAIYDMDINLIARVTVLKDAAATVAYGSKAANGVIVFETKAPVPGKLRVSYSLNTGIQLPDLSTYHLMNAAQLLQAQNIAGIYNSTNNYTNNALQEWYNERLYNVQNGVNTNWLAIPTQAGYSFAHTFSLSGGSTSLRYALSLSYNTSDGVMKGSTRNRYGINYNVSYLAKNIKLTNQLTFGYSKGNNSPWGSFINYANAFPYFSATNPAGNITKILEPGAAVLGFDQSAPGGTFTNPAYNSTLNGRDYQTSLNISDGTNVEWTIFNDLKVVGSLGWSENLPGSETYIPADNTQFVNAVTTPFTGFGSYQQLTGTNTTLDGKLNLNYNKRFGLNTILIAAGGALQSTTSKYVSNSVSGIPNDYLSQLVMANGYSYLNLKPQGGETYTKNISNYISVSYNYADRYTAEATVNQSGSSLFGSNNKLAPFYAGGFAWNISKERFFKPNDIIQSAKLRGSIGIAGNQNTAAYLSQQIYTYNYINEYREQLGASLNNYGNPNLQWQQTLKEDMGLVLGLFKGKLNANIDVYREITNNLILPLNVAPSTGFLNYQDNLGSTRNQGFEVTLSAPIIKNTTHRIIWTVALNAGHYSNILTKLSPGIAAVNNANNTYSDQTAPLPLYVEGQSMTRIWAVPSLGIDPATGQEVYVKLDGSRTFTWSAADKRPIADAAPKVKGAFTSNLNYGNFIFNFNLTYQYGGYIYNQTLVNMVEDVNLTYTNADIRVLQERWQKPGDVSSFKSLVAANASGVNQTNATSRFVQKNDFINLASVTVGYSFPSTAKWVRASHLSAPRIMITQNDLARLSTIKMERGTGYPFAHSFNFGLSTNF